MSGNVRMITLTDVELRSLIAQGVEEGVDKALSKVKNYSDDKYITADEAAQLLGCHSETIHNRRRKGHYKNYKKIGHEYYYSTNEITRGKL